MVIEEAQPSSAKAEQAILGSIILGGSTVYEKAVAWIRDSDAFYYKDNKKIWNVMHEMYIDGIPIDLVTLTEMCKKNKTGVDTYYISGLFESVPPITSIEQYAKIVWEKFLQRATAKSAYELYKISKDPNEDNVKKMLEKHSKLVDELMHLQPSKKANIKDVVNDAVKHIKTLDNIIPFGFEAMDLSAGGMTRKEITVIGGRPSHGKTTLVLNILKALVKKKDLKIMVFSREMSNTELMRKIITMESNGLSFTDLRRNVIADEKDFANTVEMIKGKYKNVILYDNIKTLREGLIEVVKEKPDIIIDDYIQLIDVEDSRLKRRFQIEKIMMEYKWIAKKENCHVILVSQLSRDIEKRLDPRPRMSDFAEGSTIEQMAESAVFVFYGYQFNCKEYSQYASEIITAKSRYGIAGTHKSGFNGERCSFYSSEDEAKKDVPKNISNKSKEWIQEEL